MNQIGDKVCSVMLGNLKRTEAEYLFRYTARQRLLWGKRWNKNNVK